MTFLQPYILWGLPLLLIPVIIHLVNRLRHRPQPWAAMRFIISASQSSINQAKLRQFLILLFRVLAVIALIFFLSRPLAGGWLGWALSPAPDVVLLVLDRSASMETRLPANGKSRREQALTLWSDAVKEFQDAARIVLMDNAAKTPQELPGAAALLEPAFTGPTDTAADLPDLLQKAFNYVVESKSGAVEVWIASDLQRSNWLPEDPRWTKIVSQFGSLPQKPRFRLLALDQAAQANASVTLVEALRRSRSGNAELAVTLDLQRNVPSTEPIVLSAALNSSSSQTKIDLPEQALRWRQNLPLSDAHQTGWGKFEISADGNETDNKAWFVFGPEKAVRSIVVTTDAARARALQLAAADFSEEELQPARVVLPEQFGSEDLSQVSLVVWAGPPPAGAIAEQLSHFIESGAVALFFPTEEFKEGAFNGMGWGQLVNAPTNQSFVITKWNEMHGPLSRTEEGLELPLRQVEVWKRAAISGTGTVLASFSDGSPFLVRKTLGSGMVYMAATSPHSDWSTLAEGPVLVPLVQRLHSAGAHRFNAANFLECGQGRLSGEELRNWSPVESDRPKDPRLHAGIYRAGQRLVAVNRPAAEDAMETLPAGDAPKLFGNLPFQMLQERATGNDRLQGEVWRMFVLGMLLFLLVEGLLLLPASEPQSTAAVSPHWKLKPKAMEPVA